MSSPRSAVYAGCVAAAAVATILSLPDAHPSSEPAYLPLAAALLAGVLLTPRLRPGEPGAALLIIPALVADVRFGLAVLPVVGFATLLGALIRRVRGPTLLAAPAHDVLVFAAAHLLARAVTSDPLPNVAAFAAIFALGQVATWHIARRLGVADARLARPDAIVSLALAPLGALPLLAWARFGDGGLLLGLAGLLAVLALVVEARSLATARAEAEAERDRLARANALQQDLVDMITHELKTPLTTVIAYTQIVERSLGRGQFEKLPEHLGRIMLAARGLQRLIDNLLQMTRVEDVADLPPPEPVDLAELARAVAAELEPLAEQKRLHLHVEMDGPLPAVLGQPFLLHEALSNLVSNAVKYTPEGGDVRIWSSNGPGNTVVLGVTDTGIGLSEADVTNLFTRFFRSADPRVRAERGSGLGLALTQAIITRIGGRIEVASQLNQGTTFRVVLPRTG